MSVGIGKHESVDHIMKGRTATAWREKVGYHLLTRDIFQDNSARVVKLLDPEKFYVDVHIVYTHNNSAVYQSIGTSKLEYYD